MDVIDLLPTEDQIEVGLADSVKALGLDDYLTGIETATNDVSVLNGMVDVIQSSEDELDDRALQIVQCHIGNTEKTYSGMIQPGIAIEAVEGKSNRALALEGIGSLIEKIVAMIKATFQFIVDAVKNILGIANGAKETAKLKAKEDLLKDMKSHPEKYDPEATPKEGEKKFIPPVSNYKAKVFRIGTNAITPDMMLARYGDVEEAVKFLNMAINHFGSQLGSLEKLFDGLENEGFSSDNVNGIMAVVNKFTAAVERLHKVTPNEVKGTPLEGAEYIYAMEIVRDTPRVFVAIGTEDNPFNIQHCVENLPSSSDACTVFDPEYFKGYQKLTEESIHLAKSRKEMFDLMQRILGYLKPIETRLYAQLTRIKTDTDGREDPALNKDMFDLLKHLIRSLSQYTVFMITATMQIQEFSDHLDDVSVLKI